MKVISLQSGSNGNCIYVETGGVKLLFDAGICCKEAGDRLAACGRDIRQVDAVIISHDHADHSRYAGVYQRRHGLPLYVTPRTLERADARHRLGRMCNINFFFAGGTLRFGEVSVHTVPTPHDCADGAVFIIEYGRKRLGIMTDLGHVFKELGDIVPSLDAVVIESNYDPDMLEHGPYPRLLKRRIRGLQGHLSNPEAAELLRRGERLKWACLAHLSEQNNNPSLALRTHRAVVPAHIPLYVAGRYGATGMLQL
jgi:phosphoribosyl 1,2-cyclic phosphodiesterase